MAVVKYMTQYFSIEYAAIIWAFPLSIIPTIIFMYFDGEKDEEIISLTKDYAIFYPTLLLFLYLMSYLVNIFPNNKMGIIYSLVVTFVVWIIVCVILFNLLPLIGDMDDKHPSSVLN